MIEKGTMHVRPRSGFLPAMISLLLAGPPADYGNFLERPWLGIGVELDLHLIPRMAVWPINCRIPLKNAGQLTPDPKKISQGDLQIWPWVHSVSSTEQKMVGNVDPKVVPKYRKKIKVQHLARYSIHV